MHDGLPVRMEKGTESAASVRRVDLGTAFSACAAAHLFDSCSDAHLHELTEQLAAVFPFACKPLVSSTSSNRDTASSPPGPFSMSKENDESCQPLAGGPPGAGEDQWVIGLTALPCASSEPFVVSSEGGASATAGVSPSTGGTAQPLSTDETRPLFVVKKRPQQNQHTSEDTAGDADSTSTQRHHSPRPVVAGTNAEEAELKEALSAIHVILEEFSRFLLETVRAVGSGPDAAVGHAFNEDSEDDWRSGGTPSSSVTLNENSNRYAAAAATGSGGGGVVVSTAFNRLGRPGSPPGVAGDSSFPATDQGLMDAFDAASTNQLDRSSGSTHNPPGFLAGSETAAWQTVVAVSTTVFRFIRQQVFCNASDDTCGCGCCCSGEAAPVGCHEESRSRSSSPSSAAACGGWREPVSLLRPSPTVVALRREVMSYARKQIAQGLQHTQPPPQRNQYDTHQHPNSVSAGDAEPTKRFPSEEPRSELDRTVDRVVVPWWIWGLSSMGVASDPVFTSHDGGGGGGGSRREQSGVGFLLAVTDYLAACYSKAQLREGAASDFATFVNYTNMSLDDATQQHPTAGASRYDGALFTAVTAKDLAMYMNDRLTMPEGSDAATSLCTTHCTHDHGAMPRSSLLHSERDREWMAGGGGGSRALRSRNSGHLTPYDGARNALGVAGGPGAYSTSASYSLMESTDACVYRPSRTAVKDSCDAEDENEDMVAASVNLTTSVMPRASYVSMDRVLRDAAGATTSGGAVTCVSEQPVPDSLFASASLPPPSAVSAAARHPSQVRTMSEETVAVPRLSKLAEAEQMVSRAGKAIEFGVKLGALYATQDMNALLSLLPPANSTASAVPHNGHTRNGRQGGDALGKGSAVASSTFRTTMTTPTSNGATGVDAQTGTSGAVDALSPSEGGGPRPPVTDAAVSPQATGFVAPPTPVSAPRFLGTGVQSSPQGALPTHERRSGGNVGFCGVPKGGGNANLHGGAGGFHGLHNKLRTGERRARMRDLEDYIRYYFTSPHSRAGFAADPDVADELAFCLSLILLNRTVTTKLMEAPEQTSASVCSAALQVFGSSSEVWKAIALPVVEDCACALMQALERQHVMLIQELSDFLAVLVAANTTEGTVKTAAVADVAVSEGYLEGSHTPCRAQRHEDPVANSTPCAPDSSSGVQPQRSMSFPLAARAPTEQTAFPRRWLKGFTQVADMAKHLLSCGHGSPKPLETATWYLAGMAEYLGRLCVLTLPLSHSTASSSSIQQKMTLLEIASPTITGSSSEAFEVTVKEVITNSESYFKAIVGFMEALADVFTREIVESGLLRDGKLEDMNLPRGRFTNAYRSTSDRGSSGGGGLGSVGDENDNDEDYSIRRSRHNTLNSDDGGDETMTMSSRCAHGVDSTALRGIDDDGFEEGYEGGGDLVKEHYKWMELCVHYFLEILDTLIEASLSLKQKPLFLYVLIVGLTRSGPLGDSYPERFPQLASAASGSRYRESSCGGTGVGFPPPAMAARFSYDSAVRADSDASEDSLNRLQHFLNAYCGIVVQRAVNGKFSLDADLLASYGSTENVQGGSTSALGVAGITSVEEGGCSNTNRSFSMSTTPGNVTASVPLASGSEPPAQQHQLPEVRSSVAADRVSPPRLTPLIHPAKLAESPHRALRPSTMWWPSQPFQSRRHLLRVTEHAALIAAFLQETPSVRAPGHAESEERNCQRAMRRRRSQIGGSELFFTALSSILDTANGPCAQLLSLPCAFPALAAAGTGAHKPGTADSAASLAANATAGSATNSVGGGLFKSDRRSTSQFTPASKVGSQGRSLIASDKALLSICGGLLLRIRLLSLLLAASIPMDRVQGTRFSRNLRRSLSDVPASGARQHYNAISVLLPCSFSVLPGSASATYVRLLFLRIVQAFYSNYNERNATHMGSGGGGGAVGAGLQATTAAAAVSTDEDGNHRGTMNSGGGLSPALCQASAKLWSAYCYQLLHALSVLCWYHAEAHNTATTLSIPSVLSRFLQVVMEEEAAMQPGGSESHSNLVFGANSTLEGDDDDDVGLLGRRLGFWRGPGGVDDADIEIPKGFKDFEDSDEDDEEDDAPSENNALRVTQPLNETAAAANSMGPEGARSSATLCGTLHCDTVDDAVCGSPTRAQPPSGDQAPQQREGSVKGGHTAPGPSGKTLPICATTVSSPREGGCESASPTHTAALGPSPRAPQPLQQQPVSPSFPLTIPKLSLADLGPALYFASSGDTGAAQEAQLLLNTPGTMTTRLRSDRRPTASNATTNIDDDPESSSLCVPFTPGASTAPNSHSAVAPEEGPSLNAMPGTPTPELLCAGSNGFGECSSLSLTSPAAAPFCIPKLSFENLGPALYFASSGDTGAFMELSALNPSPLPATRADALQHSSTSLSKDAGAGDPPCPHTDTAPHLPCVQHRLSSAPATGSSEERHTAVYLQASAPDCDSESSGDDGTDATRPRNTKASSGRSGDQHADDSVETPSGRPMHGPPPFVPPLSPLSNRKRKEDSNKHRSPSPERHQQQHPSILGSAVPGTGSPRSASFTASVLPATPVSPEVIAELILCLSRVILQRGSGFIQYSFTVSSLTQRRAHMSYAVSQPRMLYGILLDSSVRSSGDPAGNRFSAAAAAAAPHGPSTYHVIQSLSQYLLQRSHAPVVAILKGWLENRYGELMRRRFVDEVERPAREGWEIDREVTATAESIEEELHACPPLSMGHFVLLRLLLPDRKLLRNFLAVGRIGSGGFGSVMSVCPEFPSSLGAADGALGGQSPTSPTSDAPVFNPNGTATPRSAPVAGGGAADPCSDGVGVTFEEQVCRFLAGSETLAVKIMPIQMQGSECGGLPVCHCEALAMMRLRRHPHISTAFTFGCTSKEFFLITPEYTGGSFLSWRLKTYPPGCLPIKQRRRVLPTEDDFTLFSVCADVFAQVLEAVAYAHSRNIRHGDIKADNVFVSAFELVATLPTKEAEERDGATTKNAHTMRLPLQVRLGDFGSCDPCEDDDMGALLRDLETGEARFLGGRWGTGKGTEAIQPPELMVPKRRYEILMGILQTHRDRRQQCKAAHDAHDAHDARHTPLHSTATRAASIGRNGTIAGGFGAGTGTAAGGSGAVGAASFPSVTTAANAAATGSSVFLQTKPRAPEDDGDGELSGSYFEAIVADLRRAELSVDVWACGCLLYEMITGQTLFGEGRLGRLGFLANSKRRSSNSGANGGNGGPRKPLSRSSRRKNEGREDAGTPSGSCRNHSSGSNPRSSSLDTRTHPGQDSKGARTSSQSKNGDALQWDRLELLEHVGESVVGFLSRLLSLDPMQRPTAEEALHRWREIIVVHPLTPQKRIL